VIRLKSVCLVLLIAVPALAQAPIDNTKRKISSPIGYYDDADVVSPGLASISQEFGYGKVLAGHDTSFPSGSFSLGLFRRMDVSVSSGFVRSEFEKVRVTGMGDMYAGTKLLLVTEGRRRPALAIKPTIEILGDPSIANNPLAPDRINYVIPIILQKSTEPFNVSYTGGYFTRGIQFHSVLFELNRWERVTPTVGVSHARLTRNADLVSDLGLNLSRTDAFCGVAFTPSRHWSLYASTGRSLGRTDANSTRFQISGGISFRFRLWGE
jgi:hypothetical protein